MITQQFGRPAYGDFTDGMLKFKFSLSNCSLNITQHQQPTSNSNPDRNLKL